MNKSVLKKKKSLLILRKNAKDVIHIWDNKKYLCQFESVLYILLWCTSWNSNKVTYVSHDPFLQMKQDEISEECENFCIWIHLYSDTKCIPCLLNPLFKKICYCCYLNVFLLKDSNNYCISSTIESLAISSNIRRAFFGYRQTRRNNYCRMFSFSFKV